MGKQAFLEQLRKGLSGLPQDDIDERLTFYSEMIDDRIEEGLSEAEAISAVGSVEQIIAQIMADAPRSKITKDNSKQRNRLSPQTILLLALGAPIWLSLGIAAVAVLFSLYVSAWAVIISLWAVFGSLVACSFSAVIAGIVFICTSHTLTGLAVIAAGIVCAGLSIFMSFGCKAATNILLILTKKIAVWTKNRFIKKEVA